MWTFLVILVSFLEAVNSQTSSGACNVPTATVSDYDSAASLASSCKDLSGSLEISSNTAEDIVLDGLESIGGDLICVGETTDGFTAISSSTLNEILGELKLESITYLSTIDLGKLESIGGLDIASNEDLQNFSLPALTYSSGPMIMSGNFTSIMFPQLKVVNGTFKLSSATDIDCSAFDNDDLAGVFAMGSYSCSGRNTTSPTTSSALLTTSTIALNKGASATSSATSSAVPSLTLSGTQGQNTSPSSTTPAQAKSNTTLTTKEKLAIGLGTGLAILFIITLAIFWWSIRASHKKHEDRISRVPILLTGNMALDHVPETPRLPGHSRFGDPRHSGLSYHEVHTELEELHAIEKTRSLTGLEKEREQWLMEHMFLRAEPVEPPEERAELEG